MRLIDADALLKVLNMEVLHYADNGYDEWLNGIRDGLERAMDTIEDTPAVDAEPVRHGEWKPFYEVMEVFTDIYLNTEEREVQTGWECSVCGRYSPNDLAEMPYCHCGAKMVGGKHAD